MGAIIRTITALSAALYGVNILEVSPPRAVKGVSSNVLGMVADLPWGPTNEVTLITSLGEFLSTFYPNAFGTSKNSSTYPAIRALLAKTLPGGGLKVVRIAATSAAKAASAAITAGTGTVTVTAKYKGALGNTITYRFMAATDADAAKRNLVIAIGTEYSATYENLTFGTVTAVDDPYVDVTGAAPSAMPTAGAATALTGGSNGTAVAGDYVGSGAADVGIQKFYGASVDCNVLFVAECPTALVDTVNAGLVAWADTTGKGIAVLSTPDAQASADALSYVADESLDSDRGWYTWPRVQVRDLWDADQETVEVDGNAFAAFLVANVDPWLSPGGAGKLQGGKDFLKGVVGLETESTTLTTLNLLNDAGVCPWLMERTLGPILHKAVTTDGGRVFVRRTKDWIAQSLAGFSVNWAETQLDIDLENQALGPNTQGLLSGMNAWLEQQKGLNRIKNYSVDAFSANTEDGIDAGQWVVVLQVELYSMIEQLVLMAQIGETVTITEA
jgi:hypothetical protein